MFLEMGFLKQYTFLLGDPVLSLSFVLAALLLFSGQDRGSATTAGAESLSLGLGRSLKEADIPPIG